jgi:sugar lactone lactonase YvrE
MKKLFFGLVVLGLLISACQPPIPPGIGPTGGTITTPNNTASLTIPAGTFTAPVDIKLEPIIAPPIPLEYEALNGGSFQITAPSEFNANQDVTLEIEDSTLTTATGKQITTQAFPAGSIAVALVQRPNSLGYQMLEMRRAPGASRWQVAVFKDYICYACQIIAAIFTPTRVEINLSDVPEGSSVQASLTLFNKYGDPLSSNFAIQLWSSDDPSIASVDANGLVKGLKVGQTRIRAKTGSLGNPFLADKLVQVTAKPVVFTANYSAGTIKGYSRGQLASSGSPSPLVTLTLPNGTTPNDLEFDSSQNLWVSDNTGNKILRFTPAQYASSGSPVPSVIISTNGNNSIFQPVGLAFDSSGNLWVANNASLVRFAAANLSVSGTPNPDRTITGASVNFPGGITLDASNNLWAAMFNTNKVQRWTPSEQSSSAAPGYTISPTQQPAGLTFDSSGNLYVGQIGSASTSGIAVYLAAQLGTTDPSPTRTLGLGATNQVYGVAFDPNIGGIWANNQATGSLIGFSAAQLGASTTTPAVTTNGATQANGGYGGVATSSNSNPVVNIPPSINSFTATPNSLATGGGNVTFNWNVTGATSLSINQGIGTVTGSSTSRNVTSTTTFVLTATNANGSVDSGPVTVTVNVLGRKLWHASLRENLIRGYNEAKWGGANPATAPDTTLNVSACGNVLPNDLIQDNAGNIIFSAPGVQKVIRIAAAVVAQNGIVNVTAGQCETIFSGINEFIGLALDTDGRSFFVGTQNGVRYLKYNAGTNTYANQNLPVLNLNVAVSGLHLAANRLYAVEYVDFGGATTTGKIRVYDLDANRINDATLRLTFQPNGNNFRLPEGISIAAGRLWIANNSGDNLMGFKLTDINATPVNNQVQQLSFISKNNTNVSSFMHCPGGVTTAPNGELWVNVQGGSAANANCGSFGTALGNIYKYSAADLADASSPTAAPTLQFSSIVSVPGYGGLFFGK